MLSIMALLSFVPNSDGPPPWAAELLSSAKAAQPVPLPIRHAVANPPSARDAAPDPSKVHDGSPLDVRTLEEFQRSLAESQAVQKRVNALVAERHYEAAHDLASRYAEQHPDFPEGMWPELPYTSLLTGRYAEAEAQYIGHLRKPGHNSPYNYVGLSLAVALQGRSSSGQGGYAHAALGLAITETGKIESGIRLEPPSEVPNRIVLTNLVTLGITAVPPYGMEFLQRARSLDPKSEMAAFALVREHDLNRRYDEAARIATDMVARLPSGAGREAFAQRLQRYKNRRVGP